MNTRNLLLLTGLLILATVAAGGGTRSCTTAMVNLNICRTTTDVAYCLAIGTVDPDGAGGQLAPSALVADAFAAVNNWQTPTACTPDMVKAGICSAGQIGALVPITKAQFADLQVRAFVMDTVRRYQKQAQLAATAAAADAAADPDIGN